jgi:hypothetical protein
MRATISWWDLAGSGQTIDSMRGHLRDEGVEAWRAVAGMRAKFWISDPETDRWGAVMLWDSAAGPPAELPPNRAAEILGRPPSLRMATDVEAVVEGLHSGGSLDLGLMFGRRP